MTADGRVNDPDALRAEIVRTRAELGATVEALAAKADVTGRAKAAVSARRSQLAVLAGATMVVGVVIALVVRARRR
ncbi:DUF3618 domain-containing protein [Dactylosporangium sp. NPDC051541]|uniref:DUF3618 domain-containing protein n=1 Tax=Dactylosporangium sp. NPDC051541 TaxID=3363977 RepID=UPI0037B9B598